MSTQPDTITVATAPFPSHGEGMEIVFNSTQLAAVQSRDAGLSGVFLGPTGELLLMLGGKGCALRLGSSEDCSRLLMGLASLTLHLRQREEQAVAGAASALEGLLAGRTVFGGVGNA